MSLTTSMSVDGLSVSTFIQRARQYAELSKKTPYKMAAHIGQNFEVDAKKAMKGKTQPFTSFRARIARAVGSTLLNVKPTSQSIEAAKDLLQTTNEKKMKGETRKRRVRVEWTPEKNPYVILRYTEITEKGKTRHWNRTRKGSRGGQKVSWAPKKGQRDWSSVRYLAKALTVRRRMFSTGFLGGQLADGTRDGQQIKTLKNIASSSNKVTTPRSIYWNNYNISRKAPRTLLSTKGINYIDSNHSQYYVRAHAAFLKDGERTFGVLEDAIKMSTQNLEKSPYIQRLLKSKITKPETL